MIGCLGPVSCDAWELPRVGGSKRWSGARKVTSPVGRTGAVLKPDAGLASMTWRPTALMP
jgi:hypothetical protein